MKILITDDSQFMRTVLQGILKEAYADAEIIEAENGEEALAMLSQQKPDLMLMDLIMPGKGGIDVLKEVDKSLPTKVVVISALGQDQIIEEAKSLGALDFIVKPFEDEQVKEVVGKVMA